jgi:phage-related protein
MPPEDRRAVGRMIAKVEFGWPIGMPVARPLGGGLHEIRVGLAGNRIVRVFFYVSDAGRMVLLHGFVKKTQRTPAAELKTALHRMEAHRRGN